jgi:hypothetical protein
MPALCIRNLHQKSAIASAPWKHSGACVALDKTDPPSYIPNFPELFYQRDHFMNEDEIDKDFADKCAPVPDDGEIEGEWVHDAVEKYRQLGVGEDEAKRRLRAAIIPPDRRDLIRGDAKESVGDAFTRREQSIVKHLF